MISRICDRCGQPLEAQTVRYIARIQVYAAYDPLEITFDDLSRDFTAEMRRILEECRDLTEEELMRDVYKDFSFDLCPACQKRYIQNPLQIARPGN